MGVVVSDTALCAMFRVGHGTTVLEPSGFRSISKRRATPKATSRYTPHPFAFHVLKFTGCLLTITFYDLDKANRIHHHCEWQFIKFALLK